MHIGYKARTSTHWLSSYKVVMSRHECELLYFTTASPTYIVGEAIYNGAGKPWNNTAQIHLQKIFRQGGSSGENWGNKDHKHISASFARLYTRMQGEGWVDAWIKYSFPYVLNCWHVSSLQVVVPSGWLMAYGNCHFNIACTESRYTTLVHGMETTRQNILKIKSQPFCLQYLVEEIPAPCMPLCSENDDSKPIGYCWLQVTCLPNGEGKGRWQL